jgi:hypothetical protein
LENPLPSAFSPALGKGLPLPRAKREALDKAGQAVVVQCQTWQLCRALRQKVLGKGSLPSIALGKAEIQILFFLFFYFCRCKHNKSYIYITWISP